MEKIQAEFYLSRQGKSYDQFIDILFRHYRRVGFPYYPTNKGYRLHKFEELMDCTLEGILVNNVINRTVQGNSLAWSYFPHAFEVRCAEFKTAMEAFKDDFIFRKLLSKCCRFHNGVSDTTVRGMLKIYSGVQGVSNFRPTAAASIYDFYAKKGVVWDMSGGWGGRLLGAIKADLDYYIATEPSTKTFEGLNQLGNDFWQKKKFEIVKKGSEEYKPQKNSLTLCFTSPPYFNLEKYSDEKTQSWKKYSTKNEWVEGFLMQTIENCHYGLKKSGYMIINIADPKKEKKISLEQETLKAAKKVGFTHVNTLVLVLKSPLGSGQLYKTEPVFVFKK